jgi:hypothetical protein
MFFGFEMKFFSRNNRIFFKNLKAKIPFLVVVFAFIFYINSAKSAFNEQLNYQGKLTSTTNNQAIADGSYNIEFKLYTASTGGSPVWTETCTSTNKVSVVNGLFSHLLGSVNTLDDSIFNQDLYLSINIGGTSTPSWDGEMSPRKKLGSVSSAFEAKRLGGKLESQFGAIAETESISGLWTFSATTTMATTTISSSTITTLYAGSLNVNGTSSTLWDQAYNYFNASSTNLNTTHFKVNTSSTYWDTAYVKGLYAYGYAHATATENVVGLEFSGQQLNLTGGYNIPTDASTTDWASTSQALNTNDGKWTEAYSYAHATATENVVGLEFSGQQLNLTGGYNIPTDASTTDWASTSQALNANDANWTSAYSYVNASSSNLDWTHDYVLASSTNWDTAYNRLTGTLTDNKYCIWNNSLGKIVCNSEGGTGSGVPGGSDGDLQFKTGADFDGDSDLNWNSSTNVLNIRNDGDITMQYRGQSNATNSIQFFDVSNSRNAWRISGWSDSSDGFKSKAGFYYTDANISGLIISTDGASPFIGIGKNSPNATLDILSIGTAGIMQIMTSTTNPAMYVANKGQVGIGTTTPTLALSIEGGLQLGPTSTAPTAINGAMYYDASFNKFLCYENGAWYNCIGGPAGSHSYVQYNNSGALGGQQYFVYDSTNHRLGVGTSTPTSTLEVYASTTNPVISITAGENTSYDPELKFLIGANPATKIKFGYDTSETDFRIVKGDDITASIALEVSDNLNVGIGTSSRTSFSFNTVKAYVEGASSLIGDITAGGNLSMTKVAATFNMTGANSQFSINGNIRYGGTLTNAYPDLAEKFLTQDQSVGAGDVVAIDIFNKENVVKTNSEYQANAMGVVSTQPGIIMGGLIEGQGKDIALAGRIPVKINLNNGEIKAGDYLTSSDVPGIAMKATKAGKVLGMAMEGYTQADVTDGKKTIIMFVDPQFLGNDLAFVQTANGNIVSQAEITLENIKIKLADIGIIVNANGYLEATTIKTRKLATEEIELTDKSTGEIYCIWYQNGARQEQKGKCDDIFGNSDVPADTTNPPLDNTTTSSTTLPVSTTTTTTPDATTTQPTEEPVPPQNQEPAIEPVIQNNVVNEPTPEVLPTETPSQ